MSAICTARVGSSKQSCVPGYGQRPRKTPPPPQDTRGAIYHTLALLPGGPGTFVGGMNETIREARRLSPEETCLTGGYLHIHLLG